MSVAQHIYHIVQLFRFRFRHLVVAAVGYLPTAPTPP